MNELFKMVQNHAQSVEKHRSLTQREHEEKHRAKLVAQKNKVLSSATMKHIYCMQTGTVLKGKPTDNTQQMLESSVQDYTNSVFKSQQSMGQQSFGTSMLKTSDAMHSQSLQSMMKMGFRSEQFQDQLQFTSFGVSSSVNDRGLSQDPKLGQVELT